MCRRCEGEKDEEGEEGEDGDRLKLKDGVWMEGHRGERMGTSKEQLDSYSRQQKARESVEVVNLGTKYREPWLRRPFVCFA